MFLTPRYELVSFLIKFNHQFCYFLEATLKKPLLYSITRYRSKGDLTVINKKKCVNVSEFIIYQFQYCHYSSKFRFNVHSIQFKNSVIVAKFVNYETISSHLLWPLIKLRKLLNHIKWYDLFMN